MPTAAPRPAPAEADYSDRVNLADYVNMTVAIEVVAKDIVISQQYGERDVLRILISKWDGTDLDDPQEATVFWRRVYKQLEPEVGTEVAVVGRIVRKGRAYELEAVDEAEQAKIAKWIEKNA